MSVLTRVFPLRQCGWALLWAATPLLCAAQTVTPEALLAGYSAEAKATPSPERGQKLFTTNFKQQLGWSCSTCHGAVPTKDGKDDVSEKKIKPLAPAFNAERFTNKTKVENAFRLNCRDVVGRDCNAGEKADVLSWLISLKP